MDALAAPRAKVTHGPDSPLIQLAAAKFPNLTHAERALLEFADIDNIHRGEFAVCGTSADPADPSNDPKDAIRWTRDRDIRVELIQWLAIVRSASDRIDPKGLRALGARIVGSLDLSRVQVPFGIMFARCWIAEPMNLERATIPFLGLQGSYTSEIDGIELNVGQDLDFGSKIRDFHSSGCCASSLMFLGPPWTVYQFGFFHPRVSDCPALKRGVSCSNR